MQTEASGDMSGSSYRGIFALLQELDDTAMCDLALSSSLQPRFLPCCLVTFSIRS